MREAIDAAGGVTVGTEGDSFFAVFPDAPAAVAAAVAAQRALAIAEFPGGEELLVRMGLHTGLGSIGGDNYVGIDVHRAARISAAGHGGQILLSAATMSLAELQLPAGVTGRDLGEHQLKDLHAPERLYRLAVAGLPDNPASPRSIATGRSNVPAQLSSFVGRRSEIRESASLLGRSRLLTLTGPGGTGKTRLSIELAQQLAASFPDGVSFVALAGITTHEKVAAKILESFPDHVADSGTPTEEHLLDYVARRGLLLILDNFEHVIGAAPLIPRILQASDGTKIIVTSRMPLRVAGEQELPIPPLPTPGQSKTGAESEAVTLFAERARLVRPSFELDDRAGPVVAELVEQLDGLPLAIELAASRVRTLSPQAILDNLSEVMAGEGHRDLPDRQRTMQNTIAWSYDLLTDPARRLLAAMSVFAGGAVFEDVATVAGPQLDGEILQALDTLVEHSLVARSETDDGARFRMLEVVRQFGERELDSSGLSTEIAARHARTYAQLVASAEPMLTTSDSKEWLDKLSAEHDNIRKAQQWAVDHDQLDLAYEMASSLWRYYHMRGRLFSAQELLADLLALEGASDRARSKALEAAGGVAYWSGDMPKARELYEEALVLLRRIGEAGPIAYGLYNLAFAMTYKDDLERARSLFVEAHEIFSDLDDEAGMAAATWGLGDAWAAAGDLDKARRCFEESIRVFERIEDQFGLGWALYTEGEVLIRLGEFEDARRYLERGMQLFDISDVSAVVMFLAAFASLAIAEGDLNRGMQLAGAMAGLRDESGTDLVRVGMSTATDIDPETLGVIGGELGDVFEQSRTMSAIAAVELALTGKSDS